MIFNSCQQNNSTPSSPLITGITEIDAVGDTVGNIDSSDWTLDYSWSQVEKNLFSNYNDLTHNYNVYNMIMLAYPNPTYDVVNIGIGSIDNVNITMIVVDNQFNQIIIDSYDIVGGLPLPQDSLSVTDVGPFYSFRAYSLHSIAPGNNLRRFYYIATRNDTCFYKGHGDVMEITI
tara:strand:- start:470 stop:994 length:525 start_codon:yes stop_codon:yes gene_type:complete